MTEGIKRWTVWRSAITGKFVSKAYAQANPDTTVSVTVVQRVRTHGDASC